MRPLRLLASGEIRGVDPVTGVDRAVAHPAEWTLVAASARPVPDARAQDVRSDGAEHAVWAWSGSFAQVSDDEDERDDARADGDDAPAGGDLRLFADDPRTWLGPGWSALEAGLARGLKIVGAGELWIRPHARHVISDGPSVRRLVERQPRVRLLLDPVSMLTPTMLEDGTVRDHLQRTFEWAGLLEGRVVAGVIIGTPRLDEIRGVVPTRQEVGDGGIELDWVRKLAAGCLPVATVDGAWLRVEVEDEEV